MTCKRPACRNPVTPERQEIGAVFCSAKCSRRHRSVMSPAHQRFLAQSPYHQFNRAADRKRRLPFAENEGAQATARTLVEAGAVAYENAEGLIRDVGAPRDPEDAGRVFSAVRETAGV